MPIVLEFLLARVFPLFAAFVLIGLSQMIASQHGDASGNLTALGKALEYVPTKVLGLFNKASRFVVSHFAAAQLRLLTGWFGQLGFLVYYTYKALTHHGKATHDAVVRVHHRARSDAAQLRKANVRTRADLGHKIRHAEAHARSVGHALDSYRAREAHRIRHLTHAIDVTLPRDIGRVREREEALSRDQAKLRERTGLLERGAERTFEWIRSHPLSAVTGVFAGAVAVALTRMGFGFLRCRSWQKVGRSLTCGMGRWIGDLLGLIATFALGGLSILKPELLAEAAVAAVDEIEPILAAILRD